MDNALKRYRPIHVMSQDQNQEQILKQILSLLQQQQQPQQQPQQQQPQQQQQGGGGLLGLGGVLEPVTQGVGGLLGNLLSGQPQQKQQQPQEAQPQQPQPQPQPQPQQSQPDLQGQIEELKQQVLKLTQVVSQRLQS